MILTSNPWSGHWVLICICIGRMFCVLRSVLIWKALPSEYIVIWVIAKLAEVQNLNQILHCSKEMDVALWRYKWIGWDWVGFEVQSTLLRNLFIKEVHCPPLSTSSIFHSKSTVFGANLRWLFIVLKVDWFSVHCILYTPSLQWGRWYLQRSFLNVRYIVEHVLRSLSINCIRIFIRHVWKQCDHNYGRKAVKKMPRNPGFGLNWVQPACLQVGKWCRCLVHSSTLRHLDSCEWRLSWLVAFGLLYIFDLIILAMIFWQKSFWS